MKFHNNRSNGGTALLAVLWLTAALSAIAFSIADTVRSETERAIANQETTRAYYLARGAIERTLIIVRNDESGGDFDPAVRFSSRRRMYFQEQTGDTLVEFVSERGKMPLRNLTPIMLKRLLLAIGESELSAESIAGQSFGRGMALTGSENSTGAPAFRPSIASMENVEELLLVPGITSEMVYGRYTRMQDGSLINRGGLADMLTPYLQENDGYDPLSIHPSLLVALGMDQVAAYAFAERRRTVFDANAAMGAMASASVPLRPSLGSVFEIRATGRPRTANGQLSETRRTVSLLIRYVAPNPRFSWISPWTHLRWHDQAFSDVAASNSVWMQPAEAGVSR